MNYKSTLRLVLPAALIAAAACSAANQSPTSSGTGGGSSGSTGASTGTATAQSLAVTPADAILGLVAGQAPTLTYKAELQLSDKTQVDASSEATFTIDDPTLGSFSGAKFTGSGQPGKTTVRAKARGVMGETTLTLLTTQVFVTPGTPADAPTKFGGTPDASRAPTLVYPADGVLVPPNMNVFEFHFLPGTGNDLFELTLQASTVQAKVYFGCKTLGQGCVYAPGPAVWKLVAEAGRGKEPVAYTLRGTSASNPATVGASTAQKISFGQEDIVGGLYYWNAAAGATMRYEFGVSGNTAEVFLNAPQAGAGICVGCHVLSRDGTKMAAGLDIPGLAYKVFDVATKQAVFAGGGASFFSFSPDSTQVMTSDGVTVSLRDSTTGMPVGTNPLIPSGAMPDWSPDGKSVVYAKPGPGSPPIGNPGVSNASLELYAFDGTKWAPGPTLVPYMAQNNYYPSFSPDGAFVLFNRSPSNQNSFDAMDAEVWAVPSAGGKAQKLAAASTGGDSWPKWAPDVQSYKNGPLMWLTFSSRRAYGLRLAKGQTAQLWMTAFDPARAAMGLDPSYPAFWLPFQDIGSGNHIAQWVTKVLRKTCLGPSDCAPGEQCMSGTCLPIPK